MEKNINDLIEIVGYIKDNMATKEEMAAGFTAVRAEMATKEEMAAGFARLDARIDGVELRMSTKEEMATGFSNMDTRLAFMSREVESIKIALDAIDKRTSEDDLMIINDVKDLRARIVVIESNIRQLQQV